MVSPDMFEDAGMDAVDAEYDSIGESLSKIMKYQGQQLGLALSQQIYADELLRGAFEKTRKENPAMAIKDLITSMYQQIPDILEKAQKFEGISKTQSDDFTNLIGKVLGIDGDTAAIEDALFEKGIQISEKAEDFAEFTIGEIKSVIDNLIKLYGDDPAELEKAIFGFLKGTEEIDASELMKRYNPIVLLGKSLAKAGIGSAV